MRNYTFVEIDRDELQPQDTHVFETDVKIKIKIKIKIIFLLLLFTYIMTSCVKTEPYRKYIRKKHFLLEAQYNLKSKCCDEESCDDLINDLGQSAFKCDDLFREHHNVNEKGIVTDNDSLCTDIRRRQQQLQEQQHTMSVRRGGTNKRRRKSKTARRKSKTTRRKGKTTRRKQKRL